MALTRVCKRTNISFKAFADVIKLYGCGSNQNDVLEIQSAIDAVKSWSQRWVLPLTMFTCPSSDDFQVLLRAYKVFISKSLNVTIFNPTKVKTAAISERVQCSFNRKLLLRTRKFDYAYIPSSSIRNRLFGLESLELRRHKFDLITVYMITHVQIGLKISYLFLSSTK